MSRVKTGQNKICLFCKNEFYCCKSHLETRKYCSDKCWKLDWENWNKNRIEKTTNYFRNNPEALIKRGVAIRLNHVGSTGKHWKLSEETKKKQSLAQSKENNPMWKGGLTELNWGFYRSVEYKKWRDNIIKRDNNKCSQCGSVENLEAHHIKPRSIFPELSLISENGITLCHDCHKMTDTYAGKILSYSN